MFRFCASKAKTRKFFKNKSLNSNNPHNPPNYYESDSQLFGMMN